MFFLGYSLRRKVHPLNLLAATASIFLLANPFQLYDAGFLLSFLVFGVVVATGAWERHRPAWWSPDPFIPRRIYTWGERMGVRIEHQVRVAIIVSILCWLAAIPVTITCFGTFNLYAAVLNIALVPIVPLIMSSCMAGVMFFWYPPALLVCNAIARYLAGLLVYIGGIAAEQPGALTYSSLPASPGQAALIPLLSKDCTFICGNPSAVINPGSDIDVRFTVSPAIKDLGFSPAIIWNTYSKEKNKQGEQILRQEFPLATTPLVLSGSFSFHVPESGAISVFPPDKTISTGITADQLPIILWEYEGKRLLYAGSAPMRTFEKIIRKTGPIDILVVGFHSKDPSNEAAVLIESGAKSIVFTPNEHNTSLPLLPPSILTWNLKETGVLLIDMKTGTITPWSTGSRTK